MKIAHSALMALPLVAAIACGSSLNSPDGGTAGTMGTGTAGVVGTGGSAGGATSPKPPPTCLRDLIDGCRLTSDCQYAPTDGGIQLCYSNGVKATMTTVGDTSPSLDYLSNVYKPDGTHCYSVEVFCDPFCESQYVVWKNAAGDQVATGSNGGYVLPTGNIIEAKVTCAATVETCEAPRGDKISCLPATPESTTCTQGSCP